MKLPSVLFLGALAMLGVAAVSAQPEFMIPALVLGAGSARLRRTAKQKEITRSLAEMEKRLSVTEGELESATGELDQLKVEREFDRQLLRAPITPPGTT